MKDYSKDFEDFKERIWMNAASEGPLPKVSAEALKESIVWKSLPYLLNNEKFVNVPLDLKKSVGQLLGVPSRDVILGTSASYGLHILANGIPWKRGDEILLMQNDFPSDILPWLALQKQGVIVKQIKPQERVLQPNELEANISKRTKLFCISHVHTFSGIILDVKALSEICKKNEVLFILNLSQTAGNMPIDLSKLHVDAAVAAGYKWLCGPYGVGFVWIKPELREQLQINRSYWVPRLAEEELHSEDAIEFKEISSARKYDVFGTANFFNFVPFRASIDYWLNAGLENVWSYNNQLIDEFINHLDYNRYDLISPKEGPKRSCLIFITHKQRERNREIFDGLLKNNVYAGFWKGNIRFAPHVYNTIDDIKSVIEILNKS